MSGEKAVATTGANPQGPRTKRPRAIRQEMH